MARLSASRDRVFVRVGLRFNSIEFFLFFFSFSELFILMMIKYSVVRCRTSQECYVDACNPADTVGSTRKSAAAKSW